MPRSQPKRTYSILPRRHKPSQLELFTLQNVSGERRIKVQRIWSRKKKAWSKLTWAVFISVFLLTYVALTFASPPPSRGARPIALGNGYTAVAGDVYSLFYNPAGLSEINQKEMAFDFGRSYSVGEPARTGFNGVYARPWKFREQFIPLAIGFYGERPASGADIIDLSVGAGADTPVDRWTRGIIKFPVRMGAALTVRQQSGKDLSNRVGSSSLGLGLSFGAFVPLSRIHQFGFAVRNLFTGDSDTDGPSLHLGVLRRHKGYLNMVGDISLSSGGIWRIQPGLEWMFARGVVRPRLGWGFRDNGGIDSIATGVGFYVSPVQIDVSYLVPTKTLNDNAGQFRASLVYRFGRPQFSEIYYDRALEAANQLDQKVLTMTVKEAEMKNSLVELQQKNRMAKEELAGIKSRIRALKEEDLLGKRDAEIRDLKSQLKRIKGLLSHSEASNRNLRKKKATIRTRTIKPGDTLQSLAKEYYGDPNQWKRIFSRNSDKIDRGLPRVGTKFIIP